MLRATMKNSWDLSLEWITEPLGDGETVIVTVTGGPPVSLWGWVANPDVGHRVCDYMKDTIYFFTGFGWIEYTREAQEMWNQVWPKPREEITVLYHFWHCPLCWNPNRVDHDLTVKDQLMLDSCLICEAGKEDRWPKPEPSLFCSTACFVAWQILPEEEKWQGRT